MARKRNVGVFDGFLYRGGGPMTAWLLHRISGLGIVLFVGLHVLMSFLSAGSSGLGDLAGKLNDLYQSWGFQIFIVSCVLFHAVNGLRIIILDLWPKLIEHQREAIWIEWAVLLPLLAIAALVIARSGLAG